MSASRKGRRTKAEKSRYNRQYNLVRFGMTVEDYDALLLKQQGRCAVCNEAESVTRSDRPVQRLAVDHCHTSGKVRGLTCQRCNRTIGLCRDNPELLRKLAQYLESSDTGFRLKVTPTHGDKLLGELLDD